MNLEEELIRLIGLLDSAQNELVASVHEYAEAENDYRRARATAYLATSGTVDERRSHVDRTCINEMRRAHLAEGMKQSALEAVRNRRQQVSALQSIARARTEEAGLARTGPEPRWGE